jgi:hypothetical protein
VAYWCGVMKDDVCGDRSTIAVRLRVAVASEELALEVLVWLFGVGGGGMCATVGWRGVYPLCWMLNSAKHEWSVVGQRKAVDPKPKAKAKAKESQSKAVQVV